VLLFSARNVGPNVYTRLIAMQYVSTLSWPGDGQPRLAAEEVLVEVDLAVGRARQVRVVERRDLEHLAGALGSPDAVMIGVWIQKKPCSWKKRCTPARACGARG
jgi:hypothetical protein